MRWPWQRTARTGTAAASPAATDASGSASRSDAPAPAPAPAPAGWAFLPPLQREVDGSPPAALRTGFVDALPTRVVPTSLGTMGHLVDARAPAGTVAADDAALGAPLQRATAVDLPLRPPRPAGGAGPGRRWASAVGVQRAAVDEVPLTDVAAESDASDVPAATDAATATDAADEPSPAEGGARPDAPASTPAVAPGPTEPPSAAEPATDAPTLGAAADAGDLGIGSVTAAAVDRGARGEGLPVMGSTPRDVGAAGRGATDLPVQRTTVESHAEHSDHRPAARAAQEASNGEPAGERRGSGSDDRPGPPGAVPGAASGESAAPTIAARSIDRPTPPMAASPTAAQILPPETRRPGLGAPLAPSSVQRLAESSSAAVAHEAGVDLGGTGGPAVALERSAEAAHPHDPGDAFGDGSGSEPAALPSDDAGAEGAPPARDGVSAEAPILADRDVVTEGPAPTASADSPGPAPGEDLTIATGPRAADPVAPTLGAPSEAPAFARTTGIPGSAAAGSSGADRGGAAFVQRRTPLDAAAVEAPSTTLAMTSLTPARRIVPSLAASTPSAGGGVGSTPRVVAARVIAPDAGPSAPVQRDPATGTAPGAARANRMPGGPDGLGSTHHLDSGGSAHAGSSVPLPATGAIGPAHAEASAAWTSAAEATVQRSAAGAGRRSTDSAPASSAPRGPLAVQRFGLPSMPSMPSVPSMPSAGDLPDLSTLRRRLPGMPDMPDLADAAGDARSRAEEAASGAIASAREAVPSASELRERAEQAAGEAGGAAAAALGGAATAAGAALGGGATGPGEVEQLVRRLYGPLVRRIKAELLLDRERRGIRIDGI
ncbi:hypothetical protein [Agromyces sp. M3QZ16-3]|uniref:hypothetical protein n=1 Tax=Agromyces sp. M3QZ16-3 TaxID=3447585 RepID=UPI003F68DDC0